MLSLQRHSSADAQPHSWYKSKLRFAVARSRGMTPTLVSQTMGSGALVIHTRYLHFWETLHTVTLESR